MGYRLFRRPLIFELYVYGHMNFKLEFVMFSSLQFSKILMLQLSLFQVSIAHLFKCSLFQCFSVSVFNCHLINVSMFCLLNYSYLQFDSLPFSHFPIFQSEVGGRGGSPAKQARRNCTSMPLCQSYFIYYTGFFLWVNYICYLFTYGARIWTTCARSRPYAICPCAHIPGAYDYRGGGIQPAKPGVIAL